MNLRVAQVTVLLGADTVTMSPSELAALIKTEFEENAKLMKAAGIKPNH